VTRIGLAASLVLCVAIVGSARQGQVESRLRYFPSQDDIGQLFQGQLSLSNAGVWASSDARDLHLMGEKPLRDILTPSSPRVYRLLIETRPHNTPVVVRLSVRSDGSAEAVTKISQSSRFADLLLTSRTSDVSVADVDEFLKLLAKSGFSLQPVLAPFDLHEKTPMDQASWTLEGAEQGSYHVVCRGTAGLGPLKDSALFLLVHIGRIDLSSVEKP